MPPLFLGQANTVEKVEAIKELKKTAKTGSDDFWRDNAAQIVSVLLESFQQDMSTGCVLKKLTGLTPLMKQPENKENLLEPVAIDEHQEVAREDSRFVPLEINYLTKNGFTNFCYTGNRFMQRACTYHVKHS